MKLNKKVIGISVASLGILLSVGGAFALYQADANEASFGISQGAYAGSTGTVTYKINNTAGASSLTPRYLPSVGEGSGSALSAAYTQVEYTVALSATFNGGGNAQNFVVGNLGISLTNIPEAYRGKLAVWAQIDGYTASSLGEHYYKNTFLAEDFAITADEGHQSFVADRNVAVASSGVQILHIYLKYNMAQIDTLTQNEAGLGYSLAVTWAAPSAEFEPAYIVGIGNTWTADDGYAMAPNINKPHSEGWQWVYNNLPGTMTEAKCIGYNDHVLNTWSSGDNAVLDSSESYDVYWDGSGSSAASFDVID